MERHFRLPGSQAYAVSHDPAPSQSNTKVTLRDRSPRSVPEPTFDVTRLLWGHSVGFQASLNQTIALACGSRLGPLLRVWLLLP